ncbi:MAG: hypothetical protein PHY45_10665 [Rhodocyclaceae bacterium]|nr:hypothetical protein [Rhodocyclaceae bacterium]
MCYRHMQQQSMAAKDSAASSAEQRETAAPAVTAPARHPAGSAYERFMAEIKQWSEEQKEQNTKP